MKKTGKEKNIEKERYSKYFVIIAAISIATLLISNITSVKVFSVWKIVLPSSALLYPLTYIGGDIIAELYVYKKARFVILMGFALNAFMVLFFKIAIALPPSSTWGLQEAFESVLGTTPRMFIASLSAFLVGSLSNAYTMDLIKKLTKGKHLWMRTIGSIIVGEALDTIIFATIAFAVSLPKSALITMIICQFLWKVGYEVIATPLTYLVINKYKKLEE